MPGVRSPNPGASRGRALRPAGGHSDVSTLSAASGRSTGTSFLVDTSNDPLSGSGHSAPSLHPRRSLDILSNRSLVAYVQALYVDFMLHLTTGYGEMKWTRFVQRNRSEMIGHTINSAREAAHFYHLCVELIATVTVVIAMIATLVYQSPAAACGLIILFILFYGVHRTLLRKKLQSAASRRELSLRAIQKTISDMFSAGKEIRAYGSHRYFNDQVRTQTESVSAMNIRLAILPQLGRLFADQGVVLLFLGITIAGILLQNNGGQSLPLLVFYFVLSRRLLPLIGQTSLMAGQMEGQLERMLRYFLTN